jgi:hypothetical protein
MVIVWFPQDDERVTLPLAFFTVTVKVALLVPVTLVDDGEI